MELELVYDKMDVMLWLIMTGVTFGVIFMVIVSFMKIGYRLAPYIMIGALIVYMLN